MEQELLTSQSLGYKTISQVPLSFVLLNLESVERKGKNKNLKILRTKRTFYMKVVKGYHLVTKQKRFKDHIKYYRL